jgi:ribonuclease HIII
VVTVLRLPEDAFEALRTFLAERGYGMEERPHQAFLARGRGAVVNLYLNGKVVLGGANRAEREAIVSELTRLGGRPEEARAQPPLDVAGPRIGTDEAGKGDYFGPLVVAGCAVDEGLERWLKEWGVRDSKTIADKGIPGMARGISRLLGRERYEVITISPERYNGLHREMGSVNRILAWGHARVLENLLQRNPDIPKAVTDQFGDPRLVEERLMERGRTIELIQVHRGERDVAVAAASLLARDVFLRRLEDLSKQLGIPLPRGAVDVVGTGRRLVRQHGPDLLWKVAKVHFRTTDKVLGPRRP